MSSFKQNLHSKVELLMQSVESLDCQNSQSDKFQLIDQLRGEFKALQKRQSDFKVLCLMMTNYFQLILEVSLTTKQVLLFLQTNWFIYFRFKM